MRGSVEIGINSSARDVKATQTQTTDYSGSTLYPFTPPVTVNDKQRICAVVKKSC